MAANSSAAMELKVLINILSQGTALPTLMSQVNQLSQALTKLQNQANTAGAGGAGKIGSEVAAGVDEANKSIKAINPEIDTLAAVVGKTVNALKFLAGGFIALRSVQFLKNIADTAARTEVLNTVLHIVAVNAGVGIERIDRMASSVQKLGISAQSSREALTKFMQSGLKIEGAEGLAKAARDLAVISGMDTSQTFNRLIVNIQQLDTMGLRFMGIVVNRVEAERKYLKLHPEITAELSRREKQEALLMEVIDKARTLEGAYEAAMGNVGKQLTSLRRYYEDLRGEIGKHLLPAYSAFISELSLFLAKMQDQARLSATNTYWAERLGEAVRAMSRRMFEAIGFIVEHRTALEALIGTYATYRGVLLAQSLWVGALANWKAFTEGVEKAIVQIVNMTRAVWGLTTALTGLSTARAVRSGEQMVLPGMEGMVKSDLQLKLQEWIALLVRFGRAVFSASTYARAFSLVWTGLVTGGSAVLAFLASTIGIVIGLGAALLGLFAIAAKYTSIGTSLNSAFKTLSELLGEVGRLISNVLLVGWKALEAAARGLMWAIDGVVEQLGIMMVEMEKMPGPVNDWNRWLKQMAEDLDWFEGKLDKFNTAIERFAGLEGKALNRELTRITNDLKGARSALTDAEAAGVKAKKGVDADERVRTQLAYDEAKKRVSDLEELWLKKIEELKVADPALAKKAEQNRILGEFTTLETAASEATSKMKMMVREGKVEPREFVEQVGSLETLVKFYEAVKIKSADAVAELKRIAPQTEAERKKIVEEVRAAQQTVEDARLTAMEKAGELLPSVGAPGTLKKLQDQIAKLRPDADAEGLKFLNTLESVAKGKAADYLNPVLAEALERGRGFFEARQANIKLGLETELGLFRIASEQQEQLDRQSLENREITRDEFYLRQAARTEEMYQKERALAVQAVKEAQGALRYAPTPLARTQAQTKVAEAQAGLKTLDEEQEKKRTSQDIVMANDVKSLNNQITEIRLSTAAAYQEETALVAKVVEQYRVKLDQMGVTKDSQREAVVLAEMQMELDRIHLQAMDQQLQRNLEIVRVKQRELTLMQTILDVESARIDVAEKEGMISPREAMAQRNAQVLRQVEQDKARLSTVLAERDRTQKTLDDKRERIVREQEARQRTRATTMDPETAKMITDAETATRMQGELKGLEDSVAASNNEVVKLEAGIDTAFGKLVSYGKEFRKVFQDSLSTLISDLTMQTKTAKEAVESYGKALLGSMVGKTADNLAFQATKALADIGRKKDPKTGKVDPDSPTLFDRVFKGFGLGVQPPVGTKSDPFHVVVDNPLVTTSDQMKIPTLDGKIELEAGPLLQQLLNTGAGGSGGALSSLLSMGMGMLGKINFGGGPKVGDVTGVGGPVFAATGGPVRGPGTGTSDSIPAMVSAGEHIMPADKAAKWMPLLEGIRMGTVLPHFALGGVVALQSIANPSVIPRRYASGGVVVADAGAASVQTGGGAANMTISLHPDAMNMTLRDWLEQEVVRQQGRR